MHRRLVAVEARAVLLPNASAANCAVAPGVSRSSKTAFELHSAEKSSTIRAASMQ